MVTPTPSQIAIRDLDKLDLLVVAPAGCGKTEAMALRVAGLIGRGAVTHPQKVLVATFSNRARDNIRERLTDYVSPRTMRDRVTIANFHGLSARIFRAHAAVIGLSPRMLIPDSDWVGEQCRSRRLSFPESAEVQDLLRVAKQEPLSDTQVMESLAKSGRAVVIEIEQLRLSEERLTYDDLPRLAELILQNEDVARLYQNHFAAVIVDEFQDLTPQQLRIVNRIGLSTTTYAGDLAQGIYGFAGAEPDVVYARIEVECSERIEFADSHRSSPAVLDMVNALAHRTGGSALASADPSSWPKGGLAGRVAFPTTADEATWAVGFARFVLDRAPTHRVGVIARTGPRRRFADAEFAASGLAYHRWDDGILDTDTAKIMRGLLARLDVAEFHSATDPLAFLRVAANVEGVQDPSTRDALVDALNWCCDLLQSGTTPGQIHARIRVGDTSTLLNVPGAHLLTGHVGKGQQFDWVIILGAEDGCIPDFRAKTSETLAEEARILAVMLSRARHGVVILHSRSVEAASTGVAYSKRPSRFLADFTAVGSCLNQADTVQWMKDAPWNEISLR
jgi:DNA helicase II / ATP-dependent DNA helicase PcrA